MGMGGAGVAITTDALATYWNPAGLAMTQTVDIRIVGGGQAIDRLGIADAVNDLENFNTTDTSPANIAKAQDIANRINRPGANTSFNGAAGLYVKGHFGEHAFGFNISDVRDRRWICLESGDKQSQPGADLGLSLACQQARWRFRRWRPGKPRSPMPMRLRTKRSLSASQLKSFKARPTMEPRTSGRTGFKLSDSLGKATISTTYGIDVGAIYRPSSWLRFGVVAKDLNQPNSMRPDGRRIS